MITYPYRVHAMRVDQPLSPYYVAILPAELLLDVCFSDRLRAFKEQDGPYRLDGTQRLIDEKRLRAIGEFLSRSDAAFPNTVILAANSREDDGLTEEDDATRWLAEHDETTNHYTLVIPSKAKLAAVIDGQHRLFSFAYAAKERLSMQLICSIFFELPKPYQAQLFATINSTQKPVDKSLTYELFGYNISSETEDFWSPDKLAVFLARRLNTEQGSPLQGRVSIAPEHDFELQEADGAVAWRVSMATVVEGILRLISSNPKHDTSELLSPEPNKRSALVTSKRKDRSPLRDLYVESNDRLLYTIILNYLTACQQAFWNTARPGSFIVKTVGIQALFDILRVLGPEILANKTASKDFFRERLAPAANINFGDAEFQNASGSGRSHIRRKIESCLKIVR
jgi:DNA phosphorothioation-associated DGQHR protein 1